METVARELVGLPAGDLAKLPCEPLLGDEIKRARTLKGGAKKRQIKYVAKLLRQESLDEIYDFLEKRKGSSLRKKQEFHELEWLRDAIVNEALQKFEESIADGETWQPDWPSEMVALAVKKFPGLDPTVLKKSAWRYARSRNTIYRREIFRELRAVSQRLQFEEAGQRLAINTHLKG